jgi:flagellar biosynthesis component FlhA
VQEQATTIAEDGTLLRLFALVMKGLLREQVSLINKPVIISSFIEAKASFIDPVDFIRIIRLGLKNELAVNQAQINRQVLPASIEEALERDLVVDGGKTFLAMLPADCRERLVEIRALVDAGGAANDVLLITSNSRLRVHLKRLIDLEFPVMVVASRDELTDHQNAEHQ